MENASTSDDEQPSKYPYVCAVRRRPYLSRDVREARAEKRLQRRLANALTVTDWSRAGRGTGEWNLRSTGQRVGAAQRAEHPIIGERFHIHQLASLDASGRNPEGYGYSPRDVAELNNQARYEKRSARQNGGIASRKRRRGW